MAYQIEWLSGAIDDLHAIAAHIAADSPAHAAAVVTRMLACAAELSELPFAFGRVPEWEDENVRQRMVYSYRLIFRVRGAAIRLKYLQ